MFEKFRKFKRYKDYYDPKTIECRIAFITTIISYFLLEKIDLYNNFKVYHTPLENITLYIAAGLMGLLGVILAGIALLFGILDKTLVDKIEESFNDPTMIEEFAVSFQFIIFNIGVAILLFFVLYFSTFIDIAIDKRVYYFIILVSIYYFIFIVFYIISLTSHCINLYIFKGQDDEYKFEEKDIYDLINEIRIDYLIKKIGITSREKLIEEMEDILNNNSSIDEIKKKKIKNYIKSYYGD